MKKAQVQISENIIILFIFFILLIFSIVFFARIQVAKERVSGDSDIELKALEIALNNNCTKAILKSKSPTCGCGLIHDGSFSGKLVQGDGIFAKLLKQKGIEILK